VQIAQEIYSQKEAEFLAQNGGGNGVSMSSVGDIAASSNPDLEPTQIDSVAAFEKWKEKNGSGSSSPSPEKNIAEKPQQQSQKSKKSASLGDADPKRIGTGMSIPTVTELKEKYPDIAAQFKRGPESDKRIKSFLAWVKKVGSGEYTDLPAMYKAWANS